MVKKEKLHPVTYLTSMNVGFAMTLFEVIVLPYVLLSFKLTIKCQ